MTRNKLSWKTFEGDSIRSHVHFLYRSETLWRFLLCGLFGLLVAGCSLTVPNGELDPDAGDGSSVTVAVAIPEEIWSALAVAVRQKTILTTERLTQYVTVLARNGELSDRDVIAFEAAFPRITTSSRELTDVDVKTLLDLGHRAKR